MRFITEGRGGVQGHLLFEGQECSCPLVQYAVSKIQNPAKKGSLYYVPGFEKESELLIGLGKEEELDFEVLREVFFSVANLLMEKGETELTIEVGKMNGQCQFRQAEAIAEGMLNATYRIDGRKSEGRKEVKELLVHYLPPAEKLEKVQNGLRLAEDLIDGIFLARDLVNMRANEMDPSVLAEKAKAALAEVGVETEVWGEDKIREAGMEAYLNVARGSSKEPRFLIMRYMGDPGKEDLTALVGKGITYDSGGYSLKPTDGMVTMFRDMGGAGSVIGALRVIGRRKPKANVVGIVAACENMISGDAYKPGDIIGSLSGKTIEIGNTDAEGRLTLADAVCYASRELKANRVIELATLTGACLVALGEEYTAAITNDKELLSVVIETAEAYGEKIWELPNDKEFKKLNESKVADIKNIGGRAAGTITAGQFIEAFVEKGCSFVHLDIAGTADHSAAKTYFPEGASGVHVKTLSMLFED